VLIVPLLAGAVALVVAPVFQVREVDVSGNQRMDAVNVVAAAGLKSPGSIFLVDPASVERRLASQPWVRSAVVTPRLPDQIGIQIEEWQPVAVYRAGGSAWYLSDQAVALGTAAAAYESLVEIDGPAQPLVKVGRPALDRRLLVALVNVQRDLPGLIGQDVQSFSLDSCGSLTLVARRGWRALMGQVLTPEELASLADKVAALKTLAVAGDVDFNSPRLDYVNVMSPVNVAVKEKDSPARPAHGTTASSAPPPGPSAACG
jgi:cell division protein FtsQ